MYKHTKANSLRLSVHESVERADMTEKPCQGELLFVGLGLSDAMITLEALDVISRADSVFFDIYTSPLVEELLPRLERIRGIGKIEKLTRRDMEERSGRVIIEKLLKGENVAVLVYGDPFVATTHNALRAEAMRIGCKVTYVPGVSILQYSASLTGLSSYRFGPSVTVVYPRWGILYTSSYRLINENLKRDLHTFVFLDIDEELGPMTPDVAAKLLIKSSEEFEDRLLEKDDIIIVLERMGRPEERVYCRTLIDASNESWHHPPYSLIVPARMHYIEKEVLCGIGSGCTSLL